MLRVGAASTIITNDIGSTIQGATVGGVAKYIRDQLEASAMYLNSGPQQLLLISCDLGGLEPDITAETTAAIAGAIGIAPHEVVIGATHTGGPSVIPTNYLKPVDHHYLQRLKTLLVALAKDAASSAREAEIAFARGSVSLGYNRRICFADGSHNMGNVTDPATFTGLEGPHDHDHLAIFAREPGGSLIALLHQCTAHPCTFYGADFYSADFPGRARSLIREALGEKLPVLFFNGALGDQAQEKRTPPRQKETADAKLARCGSIVAAETLRLYHETAFERDAALHHSFEQLEAKVMLPGSDRLAHAAGVLARVDAGEKVPPFEIVAAHGATLLQKRFGDNPVEMLPLHAIQIGSAAIFTQPTELFCQFALDIKRRSPFAITSVFGITDGYRGYCPTFDAVLGGGYSAEVIYWTRFAPDTGYRMVDAASRMLRTLHKTKETHG